MKNIIIENFGDIVELNYNEKAERMEALGILSPTDVSRMLEAIAEAYAKSRSKRGKSIASMAADLAKLYYNDCGLFLNTCALVALGKTVVLSSPVAEIGPDDSPQEAKSKIREVMLKVKGSAK